MVFSGSLIITLLTSDFFEFFSVGHEGEELDGKCIGGTRAGEALAKGCVKGMEIFQEGQTRNRGGIILLGLVFSASDARHK